MRILIAILLLVVPGFPQVPTGPAQGPPPTNLTRRADGRFSANDDPANPENFETYVVVAGDTLSLIAGRLLNDQRLWPQLWEQNDHIINPHWIYPNDTILVRPITRITEAVPPPPPAPEPAPAEPAAPPAPATNVLRPVMIQPADAPSTEDVFDLTPLRAFPEVKAADLYCSGFIRTAPVSQDLKVIGRFNGDGSALASETDYVYIGQGAEDGVRVGDMYQVIRNSRRISNPNLPARDRNLGMHYIDVGQIRVVLAQPEFALARVVHSCEALEVGDFMLPFQPVVFPDIARPRSFSPFMTTSGEVRGSIVSTLGSLINFGTAFSGSGTTPGIRQGDLAVLERGIGSEGSIVYIDAGQREGARVGDIFIVYRYINLNGRLYSLPPEAEKLEQQKIAIGEVVVVKVEERVSTALVTYSTDGLALGDVVERR